MIQGRSVTGYRFRDEWLVRLVSRLPDAPTARIATWRAEEREYLSQALMDEDIMSFDAIASLIRDAYRIDSIRLERGALDRAVLSLVPEPVARRHRVVPVGSDTRSVSLAMANPLDLEATKDVESVTGRRVIPLFCPPSQLHELELEHLDPTHLIYDLIRKFEVDEKLEVVERESDDGDEPAESIGVVRAPVVRLVDGIIIRAVKMGASDIHIEHEEASTVVRVRIDGILRTMILLPRYLGTGPVVARLKIMAALDVSVHFRPQDGRAKLRIGDDVVGLRVSTLPSQNGEKVVLRILNEKAIRIPLEDLGFPPDLLERFRGLLHAGQGIVLVTGPTGSGKTTTLYAALREMASEEINVVTVEDPVEYQLQGITQVQVNEKQGLGFPTVLRSMLRQDPDVLLVGEIRDEETARIAIQAAQTGHLVLSTLHTNDSVGAVLRLADIGIERFKIGGTVLGVTAQRLVRRLCEACAHPVDLVTLPEPARSALADMDPPAEPRRAPGCPECRFTGYRGRLALIELLEVTDAVRAAIEADAGTEELRELALRDGALRRLDQDALWHVARGHTTLDECGRYLRVTPATDAAAGTARPGAGAAGPAEGLPDPKGLRVVAASGDPYFEAFLAEAGFTVQAFEDGSEALGAVARSAPDALLVGSPLETLGAAQVVGAVRAVLGLVDLPILVAGEEIDGAEMVDPGLPPLAVVRRVLAAIARRRDFSDGRDVAHPPVPFGERARLEAVRSTGLLDSGEEDRFDRLTEEAREQFDVPMALVTLVGEHRQYFKSHLGIDSSETAREDSFCAHAINHDNAFVVPDARLDPRFAQNPLVLNDPHIRFYAGQPIRSPDGHRIGTVCVLDREPRNFTAEEASRLADLRDRVEAEIWAADAPSTGEPGPASPPPASP